ncbi:thioredoxin-like protein [Cystobasidium minutum MCA 4210]|uniref:thioredoxin-like protein n=1 Tax=Cystobasidium minutum MCA 4210 TaxID=1397322 RepID=UPI0034CF84B2|eukprot:jgi/Rhomi1/167000/fgenesh1_kg.2_\
MVYKLHGVALSTCTQRVLITAQEAGVEVELVPVDFKSGEHKSEAFLKLQPFGQVPVLEDTDAGITMHESRAIARYLATKAKASHVIPLADDPDYLKKLAKFETAASIEYSNFDPLASGIAFQKIFKQMKGMGEADENVVTHLAGQLSAKLDAYEKILSKQAYLAGDEVTLADLFHIPYGRLLYVCGQGDLIDSRPAVSKWWKSITSRESVKKVVGEK